MYVYYMQNLHRSGALFFRTLFAYRCDWRCRYTFLQWHTTTWLLRSKISFGMQTFNVTLLYNKNQQQKIYNFMLISVCSITFNESTNAKSRYICWECVAEKNACISYSILCVSSAPNHTHILVIRNKPACYLMSLSFVLALNGGCHREITLSNWIMNRIMEIADVSNGDMSNTDTKEKYFGYHA